MKLCAYCKNPLGGEKHRKTDEHVIPNSLLKLYPKQDLSFHNDRVFVDNRGITLSDVCASCNNGPLSELDAYGANLVKTTFFEELDFSCYGKLIPIELDTSVFIRWMLKIAYNDIRCQKLDTKHIEKCIPYILGETNIPPANASVLLGLHINLTPVPEYFYQYNPLQIMHQPRFYLDNIWNPDAKEYTIKGAKQIVCIRAGTAIAVVVLWEEGYPLDEKKQVLRFLNKEFGFTELIHDINSYEVCPISSPTNVILSNYGHFLSKAAIEDAMLLIRFTIQMRDIGEARKEFEKLWTEDFAQEARIMIEHDMFPGNKKKDAAYKKMIESKGKS